MEDQRQKLINKHYDEQLNNGSDTGSILKVVTTEDATYSVSPGGTRKKFADIVSKKLNTNLL